MLDIYWNKEPKSNISVNSSECWFEYDALGRDWNLSEEGMGLICAVDRLIGDKYSVRTRDLDMNVIHSLLGISADCKTVYNIGHFPKFCFYTAGIRKSVWPFIYSIKKGKIYSDTWLPSPVPDEDCPENLAKIIKRNKYFLHHPSGEYRGLSYLELDEKLKELGDNKGGFLWAR